MGMFVKFSGRTSLLFERGGVCLVHIPGIKDRLKRQGADHDDHDHDNGRDNDDDNDN